MFDIALIGLGPAGATFARQIDPRFSVIAFERRRLDVPFAEGMRKKCCGGLLAPDAQRELGAQGFSLPADVLSDPQIFLVKALDLNSGRTRFYQRHYVNLDREKFDRFLFSKVRAGVELHMGASVVKLRREGDAWQITYREKGRLVRTQAKTVVCADGGGSLGRRALEQSTPHKTVGAVPYYVALQEEYPLPENWPETYAAYFDSAVTDYYAWSIPKNGRLLFGAALPPDDAKERFAELKQALIAAGEPLDGPVLHAAGCHILRPKSPMHIACAENGMFFLGEAGGFISPSSAEGLSYALKTGAILANCCNETADLQKAAKAYQKATASLRKKVLVKCIKGWGLSRPMLRSLAMQSGLLAVKRT